MRGKTSEGAPFSETFFLSQKKEYSNVVVKSSMSVSLDLEENANDLFAICF